MQLIEEHHIDMNKNLNLTVIVSIVWFPARHDLNGSDEDHL